jgi:type IV secretory pathway VirJ component
MTMALSLRDFHDASRRANRDADQGAVSVEQAEAQLRTAQERAERDARAAAEAQTVAKREHVAAVKRADAEVKTLGKQVADAQRDAERATGTAGIPAVWLRQAARAWLRGTLASPGELMPPETVITSADPAAAVLLGTHRLCANLVERMGDDGLGAEPAYATADQLETHTWRLFVARVRTLAGE